MAEAEAGPSRASSLSERLSTTGIIFRDLGPRGEHGAGRAEENEEYIDPGLRLEVEAPELMLENLKQLEGRDPLLAALALTKVWLHWSPVSHVPGCLALF